jgi:nucleotide sugar dehydrogenase
VNGLAVIGSGYVGTVVAACFAALGRDVVGVEVDVEKLESLRMGNVPFYEAGLEDLVRRGIASGRLRFTDDFADAMGSSEVVFLCVGTPSAADGRADMRGIQRAAHEIGSHLDGHHILVTKSTVPIGSGNWLASVVEEALPPQRRTDPPFSVVSNPEFLREGSAIDDFLYPDRVVLGSDDPAALEVVAEVYEPILQQSFDGGRPDVRPPLVRTGLATAETVKYAANAFLAMKISFANEISNICEFVGADIIEVAAAIGLDSRIGSEFLNAGAGWGGSCFGKDLASLISTAEEYGYRANLLESVISVNRKQRSLIVEKLQRHLKTMRGRRICFLGLAFKPGTDDLRDSPAIDLAERLVSLHSSVAAHDPVVGEAPMLPSMTIYDDPYDAVTRADAVVLTTEWPEYLGLDLQRVRDCMRGRLVIDARNFFQPEAVARAGLNYESIGRPNLPAAATQHS